jgi:hypothetical protein
MANNKSSRFDALCAHVAVYTVTLAGASVVIFGLGSAASLIKFILFNAVFHFATDYVTSRIAARHFKQQNWRIFFLIIGLDQLIHQVTLIATMYAIY